MSDGPPPADETAAVLLVIEDLEPDRFLLQTTFEHAGVKLPLLFVKDGQEAIEYLEGTGVYHDREKHPLPRILLLDLNMPRLSGFEVLEWIQARPDLAQLIKIVFSSSTRDCDVKRAYALGANSYVEKPSDIVELARFARTLEEYWCRMNVCSTGGLAEAVKPEARVILVIDDSENDAELIKRAFSKEGFSNPVRWVGDMEAATGYLKGEERYASRADFPLPSLIILDHGLRGAEGWDLLKWLREQKELKALPVVVFSGAENPDYQLAAFELGANAYHIKPQDFDGFCTVIRRIGQFWLMRPATE